LISHQQYCTVDILGIFVHRRLCQIKCHQTSIKPNLATSGMLQHSDYSWSESRSGFISRASSSKVRFFAAIEARNHCLTFEQHWFRINNAWQDKSTFPPFVFCKQSDHIHKSTHCAHPKSLDSFKAPRIQVDSAEIIAARSSSVMARSTHLESR